MDFKEKDSYNVYDLVEVIRKLRSPGGCPWDIEQTHHSIRQNLIEETYEVIEAIDKDDTELLKEELGDVLLQVVFHSIIEEEQDSFNIDDVADGVCKKMIIRHPHVFSDVKADTTEQVLKNWDAIKMQTKSQNTQSEVLNGISRSLPALMRSQKIQQKAAKVGFDWDNVDGALDKLAEEVNELKEAIQEDNSAHIEEELGDVLFSVVNVSRFVKTDAEKALYNACEKFISRFSKMERLANEENIKIQETSLEALDELWEKAKKMND
ncbi:MAG: nucleoside triphosphate pyrophosphohydrolase [Acutalibacteraceae bacterium]|nr:nucleoside triphosphate pyrophosphohydrolase [Acutalibacteraceae bacterium]